MASIKELASGRKDLFLIAPEIIHEKPGWNVREDSEELTQHIEELACSIAEIGVQQPLTVYLDDDKVYLSDGHCRLNAVKLAVSRGAEIKAVPCRVEERYASEADRVLAMITRNSGKSLTPLEKSKVIKQLLGFGWTEKEIASKIGVSVGYVYQLLEVQTLPKEVKQAVAEGQISASLAVQETKKDASGLKEKLKTGEKVTKKTVANPTKKLYAAVNLIYSQALNYKCEEEICDLCDRLSELLQDEGNLR